MNCRGHARRISIVNNYEVTPLAHLRLLNGVVVQSDAGGDITDSYYLFKCVHKRTGEENSICCGEPTARDFSALLGVELPRLFNPIVESKNVGDENEGREDYGSRGREQLCWDQARKQLYNAVMLFFMWLKNSSHRVLFSVLEALVQAPQDPPSLSNIKSVNTLYRKYGTTARNMVNELREGNSLREYRFDLLSDILARNHIEQHFENV